MEASGKKNGGKLRDSVVFHPLHIFEAVEDQNHHDSGRQVFLDIENDLRRLSPAEKEEGQKPGKISGKTHNNNCNNNIFHTGHLIFSFKRRRRRKTREIETSSIFLGSTAIRAAIPTRKARIKGILTGLD